MENTMLDPEWTPQKGYSHALGLLKICERRENSEEKVEDEDSK